MKKGMMVVLQYAFFAALAAFFVWLSLKDMDRKSWTQLKGCTGPGELLAVDTRSAVAARQSLAAGPAVASVDRADGLRTFAVSIASSAS
jgi:hypothetical protein